MTGLTPPAHGVRGNGSFALGPGPPTLAEGLRERGLATAAFIGGFPLARRFGLDRGFDHYDDTMGKAAGIGYDFAERPGAEVAAAAVAWLAAHPGRVFVWVHLFDPHAPYAPPPAFRSDDPYRGEVAAADAALGNVLATWDKRPETSLVVATADHGEAFGEHGEESHSLFVYDTTLRVPLIVRGPGWSAGRRVLDAVGLGDVGATILEAFRGGAARLGSGAKPLYAETLAPRLDFGWSELRAWRSGRYKYIRAPRPELYDVEADASESHDLAASRSDDLARMARELDSFLATTADVEARRPPDAEAAERLRALGYAQGPGGRGSGADPKDKVDVALAIARATGPFPDHTAAAAAYRDIARRDPENPLVNLRLADALLRSGRPDAAVPYFEKVIAAAPRTADAFVGLATAHAERGRLEQARQVLQQALAVDAKNGQVHYNLGEVARARGELETARREYAAALEDPVTSERARARLQALR